MAAGFVRKNKNVDSREWREDKERLGQFTWSI
jgi:hypothetical protein